MIQVLELAAEHSKVPLDQLNSHLSNQAWFDNMLVSWNGLKEGKVWTLFVSGICHDYGSKLFIDLIAIQLAGPPLLMAMGAYTPFIALLATSSVVGNLSAAAVMNFKGEPKTRIPGGQAPVAGIVTYLALISNSKQALSVGSLIFRPWALPFVLFGSMLFGDYLGDRDFLNGQTSAQWGGAAGGVLFFVVKKALRL
ncbi:hypothetical protein BDY24DRAFT_265534 [Mrakia frigida]|uniref:uncharacterized protein n=1 Tax=Mrakia frigida TaxID=29902 RepID=UPI003FCC14B6